MESGLQTSLSRLATTRNEAALDVLISALDHAPDSIRAKVLDALLARKSPKGNRELIRRWPTYPEPWQARLGEYAARLAPDLESAALSNDHQLAAAACRAAVSLRDYDLMVPLIAAAEAQSATSDIAGETLLKLAVCLYEEATHPRDYSQRRDPKLVRRFVLTALESSVGRYAEHRREEPLEAFLTLTGRENATLKASLHSGRGEVYQAFVGILARSQTAGVIRLLLSYLDEAHAPLAVVKIVSNRGDEPLVASLLEKMQQDVSPAFTANLARLDALPWASESELAQRWEQLPDNAQQAAARLIMHSGMKETRKKAAMCSLLTHGKPGARSVATASLAEISGADVNELICNLINDADPQVQACALVQLRPRNIPGAISTLIKRLESRSPVVSNAARSCLQEFTFSRFLTAFEDMHPEVRRSTGALVKKVDPQSVPQTIAELHSTTRSSRLRAIEIAASLGSDKRLQTALIACLADPDHQVRTEAVRKLAEFPGEAATNALRKMLADTSVTVVDAAQRSLETLGRHAGGDDKSTIQWADLLEAGMQAHS